MEIINTAGNVENTGEIVVYEPDEITRLEVHMKDETVWLTQTQMSALFGRDRTVITKHIRNIFTEQELDEKSNVHFLHFANSDKPVKIFSLDVIISVGRPKFPPAQTRHLLRRADIRCICFRGRPGEEREGGMFKVSNWHLKHKTRSTPKILTLRLYRIWNSDA